MRLTRSTVTVLVGLALVFALPSLAQEAGKQACEKACGISNLTPEQTAKMQNLMLEHQKAILALQTVMKTKQLEFRQLMMEGADQTKLGTKIDELAKAKADIQKKCLAHRFEIRGLLTDEQKKVFDQKCGGMGCGAGMGHGSGCGGGHGKCGSGDSSGHKMGGMAQHSCGDQGSQCAKECTKK